MIFIYTYTETCQYMDDIFELVDFVQFAADEESSPMMISLFQRENSEPGARARHGQQARFIRVFR